MEFNNFYIKINSKNYSKNIYKIINIIATPKSNHNEWKFVSYKNSRKFRNHISKEDKLLEECEELLQQCKEERKEFEKFKQEHEEFKKEFNKFIFEETRRQWCEHNRIENYIKECICDQFKNTPEASLAKYYFL